MIVLSLLNAYNQLKTYEIIDPNEFTLIDISNSSFNLISGESMKLMSSNMILLVISETEMLKSHKIPLQ